MAAVIESDGLAAAILIQRTTDTALKQLREIEQQLLVLSHLTVFTEPPERRALMALTRQAVAVAQSGVEALQVVRLLDADTKEKV